MTNKEKYKQAFSVLQTSDDFKKEMENMIILQRKHKMNMAIAVAIICLIFVGGTSTAYAANIGGIQRVVQLWIHGDQTDATLEIKGDGSYEMTYQDEAGNMVEMGGGGIAIEEDGSERPLTQEELFEHINAPAVEYEEDGTVWVYYYNQKIDITDKFDENGICYVKVSSEEETIYMTIKYQNGWSTNKDKYVDPASFNF